MTGSDALLSRVRHCFTLRNFASFAVNNIGLALCPRGEMQMEI